MLTLLISLLLRREGTWGAERSAPAAAEVKKLFEAGFIRGCN